MGAALKANKDDKYIVPIQYTNCFKIYSVIWSEKYQVYNDICKKLLKVQATKCTEYKCGVTSCLKHKISRI